MNYTFKIIDTKVDSWETKVEKAKGGSVILEWLGGDRKDELLIVGSRLKFTMVGMSMTDGQYADLFSGDETRYRVIQEDENGKMIWQGFLLPDSLSEPYSNAPILVDFEATDGLGRLKGKYLSEDFYKEEKSVIEILAACLRMTGLDLSFRFSPAIENSFQKDYNKIFIDTSTLKKKKDKGEDAYKVLNDLLESMCCTLYQADNYYNIEGLNIRNLRVYKTKIYAPDGTLTDEKEITRDKKYITGLATPLVSLQPPYGVLNVTHKQEPLALPEGLSKEVNDGWSVNGQVQRRGYEGQEEEVNTQKIFATDWWGNGGFYAYAGPEDNSAVYFGLSDDESQYINLRTQPYVEKGKKYELQINFEIIPADDLVDSDIEKYIKEGRWDNPFDFYVTMNSDEIGGDFFGLKSIVFINSGTGSKSLSINFDKEKKSENTLHFVAPYSGLLNIQIRGVKEWSIELFGGIIKKYGRFIKYIQINEASLVELGREEEITINKTLNGEFTLKKDIELVYGDDPTGLSKAFRLQKLKEPDESEIIGINIERSFPFQGSYYAEVSLGGANLIAENLDTTPELQNLVEEVIYNYNQSQSHVVKLKEPFNGNNFTVALRNYNSVTEVRDYWRQWTDTFYKVEKKRYPEIVGNIYNRLFDKPIYKVLDYNLKNNVKFNDFIEWKFSDKKDWILTNCVWDIDNGITTISMVENYYAITPGANIPPVVEAGEDRTFEGREANLTCEAYDPDGYIVSYEWKLVSGTGATIIEPNKQNTRFRILGGAQILGFYEFEITVTDNEGATASDRVRLYKKQDLTLELEEIYSVEVEDVGMLHPYVEKHFKVKITPEIPVDTSVLLEGKISAEWNGYKNPLNDAYVKIEQDGALQNKADAGTMPYNTNYNYYHSDEFKIDYIKGSEVLIKMRGAKNDDDYYNGGAELIVNVSDARYTIGNGEVTGVPVTESIILNIELPAGG